MRQALEPRLPEVSSTVSVQLGYRQPKIGSKFLCLGNEQLRKICWEVLLGGLFLALGVCNVAQTSAQEVLFYVSPEGNDAWSGKLAATNADKTDGPFATVGKARDTIRQLKAQGPLTQPVTVYLRGGLYALAAPLVFGPQDSGTSQSPITYAAYPNETPVLSGGSKITGWKKVTGEVRDVASAAQGNLWVADIPKGWRFNQLFVGGKRLPRSASPNAGRWEDWYKATGGQGKAVLYFPPGTIKRWSNLEDVEINFMPGTQYANFLAPIKGLDEEAERVTLAGGGPYDLQPGDPFRVENTLEGIDQPGEWSLDTKAGQVYLWPPKGVKLNKAKVIAPRLLEAVVLKGNEAAGQFVRYITLRGLTITHIDRRRLDQAPPPGGHGGLDTNSAAVLLWGVEDCTIEHCQITNVGGIGIRAILYAKRLKVWDNEISFCGGTGIALRGYGPGTHYVNRNHKIATNHIHHCGQIYWHGTGINTAMAGDLTLSDNHIHDMPYAGILATGQLAYYFRLFKGKPSSPDFGFRWDEIGDDPLTVDSVKKFIPGHVEVEDNDVHDVMQVLDDGGGIYFWGSHHNEIRNNTVYDCARDYAFGIYLDADELDTVIENNLVYRCPNLAEAQKGAALLLNRNGRNTVRNNIFALGNRLFRFPGSYGGHTVTNNIFLFVPPSIPGEESGRRLGSEYDAGQSVMDSNLYWSTDGEAAIQGFINAWRQKGWDKHSLVADPLFVGVENFDFHLEPDSPAPEIGFDPTEW